MGKNMLKLDTSGFDDFAYNLDRLGADLRSIFTDALQEAAETITEDTFDGVTAPNLPRGGRYSTGETKAAIVKNPRVQWDGMVGSVAVGFDFSKPGAGGYLITGTPRMRPDKALNRIYKSKKYMKDIERQMAEVFQKEINRRLGG